MRRAKLWNDGRVTKVVIIGGGPGGYEAALVGNQLGGEVTLIERDGMGGAAVLSDCVPSKTLIATAEVMVRIETADALGLHVKADDVSDVVDVDMAEVNQRVLDQAARNDLPLLERVKFLAITASNLDEFFMVRVGGLQMMRRTGARVKDMCGLTPTRQLQLIHKRVRQTCAHAVDMQKSPAGNVVA